MKFGFLLLKSYYIFPVYLHTEYPVHPGTNSVNLPPIEFPDITVHFLHKPLCIPAPAAEFFCGAAALETLHHGFRPR